VLGLNNEPEDGNGMRGYSDNGDDSDSGRSVPVALPDSG